MDIYKCKKINVLCEGINIKATFKFSLPMKVYYNVKGCRIIGKINIIL